MDDDKFVDINSNCDAGDERFVELRGIFILIEYFALRIY